MKLKFFRKICFSFNGLFKALVFILTLTVFQSAMAQTFSAEEQAELSKWGNGSRKMGTFLNPPFGNKSEAIQSVEEEVIEILKNLNPELFSKYQVVIGVYSSTDGNAFVGQIEPKKHKGKYQKTLIHNLYNLKPNKPIYHIGVTLGLFKTFRTKDQIAYILRHELAHLQEGHTDNPKDLKGAMRQENSSQQHEAVADYIALEGLLGKYDIHAALEVVKTFAILENPDFKSTIPNWSIEEAVVVALKNLQASHHNIALRISFIQAQIEYFRRSRASAQPRMQIPLTTNKYNLDQNPRLPKPENTPEEIERSRRILTRLINKAIKGEILLSTGIMNLANEVLRINFKNIPHVHWSSLPQLLDFGIQKILATPLTAQQQFDMILGMYFSYRHSLLGLSEEAPHTRDVIKQTARHVNQALVTLGKTPGYDPKVTLDYLTEANRRYSSEGSSGHSHRDNILNDFTNELPAAILLEQIANSTVGKVFLKELTHQLINRKETASANNLLDLLEKIAEKSKGGKVSNSHRAMLGHIEELYRTQNLTEWHHEDFNKGHLGTWTFNTLRVIRNGLPNEPVLELLEGAFAPFQKSVLEARVRFFATFGLGGVNQESLDLLSNYLKLAEEFPLSPEESKSLSSNFMSLVKHTLYTDVSAKLLQSMDDFRELIEEGIIQIPEAKADRIDFLRFWQMVISRHFMQMYSIHGSTEKQSYDNLTSLLTKDFTRADLFELLTTKNLALDAFLEAQLQSEEYLNVKKDLEELEAVFNSKNKNPPQKNKNLFQLFMINQEKTSPIMDYVANYTQWLEYNLDSKIGILGLLAVSSEKQRIIDLLQFQDVRALIKMIHDHNRRKMELINAAFNGWTMMSLGNGETNDRVAFLLDILVAKQNAVDINVWSKTLNSVLKLSSTVLEIRPEHKSALENKFLEFALGTSLEKAYQIIRMGTISQILSEASLVPILIEKAKQDAGEKPTLTRIRQTIEKISEELDLKKTYPDIYNSFREKAAEVFKLQPHNIDRVLPEEKDIVTTENTEKFSSKIRMASALVALAREIPLKDKLAILDYIMGRIQDAPEALVKAQRNTETPLLDLARGLRIQMKRSDTLERAFLANSFFAGPHSELEFEENRDLLLDVILKDVSNKTLAKHIGHSLLRSQGDMKSLVIGYILAQKPTKDNETLTEGQMIKALFEAFGAAGIKLGQYLAFTDGMKEYREVLAELQDSAMPIEYLALIRLIRSRLGADWNKTWEVVRILGSGSVNIAVELRSGDQVKVLSLLRKDIEIAAIEDFRKLQLFVQDLVASESHKPIQDRQYSFLPGLLKIIEQSVRLEFNKENAFERQKEAVELYNRKFGEWRLQSINPLEIYSGGGMTMEKAPGKTMRKIRDMRGKDAAMADRDQALYKEVMTIVMNVEFDHLLNTQIGSVLRLTKAFANPDLHDGQVLVDLATKTITILDFGQAVPISENEREIALEILKLVAVPISKTKATAQMQKIQNMMGESKFLTNEQIQQFQNRTERMDKFIYFLGIAGELDWKIPISSVHWVLGMNRVIQLGQIIGIDVSSKIRNLFITKSLGGSTDFYNRLRSWWHSARTTAVATKDLFTPAPQQVLSCEHLFR